MTLGPNTRQVDISLTWAFQLLVYWSTYDEWLIFQNRERVSRKTLDTKPFEDKLGFHFSGDAQTK